MSLFTKSNWEIKLAQWIKTHKAAKIFLIVTIVLSTVFAYVDYPKALLRVTGTHTIGAVTKITDRPRHKLIIEFDFYAADKLIHARVRIRTRFPSQYGKDPVNVWYDPSDPKKITTDLEGAFSFLFSLLLPPGLVIGAVWNLGRFKHRSTGSKK